MRAAKITAIILLVSLLGGGNQLYTSDYYDAPWPSVDLNSNESLAVSQLNGMLAANGLPHLATDTRLVLVSRYVSRHLKEKGIREIDRFTNEMVREYLRQAGVTDARFVIHLGNAVTIQQFLTDNSAVLVEEIKKTGFTHVGIGVESKRFPKVSYFAIILSKRPVELGTLPRQVDEGSMRIISGRPNPGIKNVSVHLTDPKGETSMLAGSSGSTDQVFAELNFNSGAGNYTVEITYEGKFGTEVAALFPVECKSNDGKTPQSASVSPYANVNWNIETEEEAEDLILKLINDERLTARLSPLALYAPASEVSRKHCRDMADNDFVGHISPTTGDASDRADVAGIKWQRITENIAKADSIEEAHRGLMGSPVHRQNVLDSDVSYIGVGVLFISNPYGQMSVLVTVVFLELK